MARGRSSCERKRTLKERKPLAQLRQIGGVIKKAACLFEDRWIGWILHLILIGFLSVAVWKAAYVAWHPGITLNVERGDRSLAWLYATYGAAIVICTALFQASNTNSKYKLAILTFDFICLTYLFLLNDWFVNNVVYKFFQVVAKN